MASAASIAVAVAGHDNAAIAVTTIAIAAMAVTPDDSRALGASRIHGGTYERHA